MMTNLKAVYEQGVLRLEEPLPLPDGAQVDVTVISREIKSQRSQGLDEGSWHALIQLLAECAIDTGIPDFARKHDRHLYRT
jgi:predicted DNA-binding antitoxin AbrB/MazE fold protein